MKGYFEAYETGLKTGKITPFLQDVTNEKGEVRDNRIILPEPSFSADQTIAVTRDTLDKVDPEFGRRFGKAV